MSAVAREDLDSLVPLFDRYQKPLYNFFLRMSSDPAASDDLVQNLFIRVMKYRASYQEQFKFRTWIYQMARNLYYDHYRTEVKAKERFLEVERIPDVKENDYSDLDEREDRLRKAMNKLPEDRREVLVMSRFQGMKYEEIARLTNTTVSNVKVKVHRALGNLREIYFQMG